MPIYVTTGDGKSFLVGESMGEAFHTVVNIMHETLKERREDAIISAAFQSVIRVEKQSA
jgi:hypothetical protein